MAQLRFLCGTLGILLTFFLDQAAAAERWILPDSMAIATYNGIPQIQLQQTAQGTYLAKINFRSSYERIAGYIVQDAPDTLISELTFTPTKVHSLLSSEQSLFLKSSAMTATAGGLQLQLAFHAAMDERAVLRFLRTLTLFGFVDGFISCPESSSISLCGKKIQGLPLYNQYREQANPNADAAAQQLWFINNYKYTLLLADPFQFKTFTDFDYYVADQVLSGCKRASGAERLFCENVRPYGSFSNAVRILARRAFGNTIGDEVKNLILSPEQIFGNGHEGSTVRFEMRDYRFAWPGTSWTQVEPVEFPMYWNLERADPTASGRDVVFGEDFFIPNFMGGFYFSDSLDDYGFASGGVNARTNALGEGFRLRGISRGGLVSARISVRMSMGDNLRMAESYLEMLQRTPGSTDWNSVQVFRPQANPEAAKILANEGMFYTIDNVYIAKGQEVMLRLVVPPELSTDPQGQFFTLYLAELKGVQCPLEIFEKYKPFCKD